MTSIFDFAGDKLAEKEGVWHTLYFDDNNPSKGSIELKIARRGGSNMPYNAAMQKYILDSSLAAKAEKEEGEEPDLFELALQAQEDSEALIGIFAEHILVDWRNVVDREGKEVPYSVKNAENLLSSVEMVQRFVMQRAGQQEHYWVQAVEATAKNSERLSDVS